jgi:hypothetical protein
MEEKSSEKGGEYNPKIAKLPKARKAVVEE